MIGRTCAFTTLRRAASGMMSALALVTGASASLGSPTLTNLGTLPAAAGATNALAISADGTTVVGQSLVGFLSQARAFRWTAAGGIVDLGQYPGGDNAVAFGVSGNGSMVVGQANDNPGAVPALAVRWPIGSGATLVGLAPSGGLGGLGGAAVAVNLDASVIVGQTAISGSSHAWRSTGGAAVDLGSVAGATDMVPHGISGDGNVIVGTAQFPTAALPFRWTQATGPVSLGAPANATIASATCISGDGNVVAGGHNAPSSSGAFRWTAGGGFELLPAFGGQVSGSFTPEAINSDGAVIVGNASVPGGGTHAAMWVPCLGTVDLQNYLPTLGVDLSGWLLSRAVGVSADGTAVCGVGAFNGASRSWIVTGLAGGSIGQTAFTTQPSTQFTCVGGGGSFFANATGTGAVAYRWQARIDGGAWNDLVEGGTLMANGLPLATFTGTHTNQLFFSAAYLQEVSVSVRALATGGCGGEATSNTADLFAFNGTCCSPGQGAHVSQNPGDATACGGGGTAAFTAAAAGAAPITTVWQINGAPLTQWTTLTNGPLVVGGLTLATVNGAAADSLTLSDVQLPFGAYQIRFVAYNDCAIAFSSTCTLVVQDCCPPGAAPTLAFSPGNDTREFSEGIDYFLPAGGDDPITYQWQLNGGPFADWTTLADGPLVIDGIARANVAQSGTFNLMLSNLRFDPAVLSIREVASNVCGMATSPVGTLTINERFCFPEDKAQFGDPPADTTVCAGQPATFTGTPGGVEPLALNWQVRAGPNAAWLTLADGDLFIDEAFRATVSGSATATLTLANVQFAPGEVMVRLVAANECSIAISGVATLTIATGCCPLDYNLDTVLNPDDLGDFITDYFTDPPVPGPGGYAIACPENDPPYDAGYKAAFTLDFAGQCNQPFPDNLGDYITAYFGTTCG